MVNASRQTSANADAATVTCRALLISAQSSGVGKTSVTAAFARRLVKDGLKVRVFKTGPDFLDPMVLEVASGAPVYQLDLWMVGEAECTRLISEAAAEADVILVEGVMGLYDGDPSSADLATFFGLQVAVVIDASAMAQTFAAVAQGLLRFKPLAIGGVIANRVASERHGAMLSEGLDPAIPMLGILPRMPEAALPERHLGLVQAAEVADLGRRIDLLADAWKPVPVPLPDPVSFKRQPKPAIESTLEGVRIAIARDRALAFLYRANVDLLIALGAKLEFFSVIDGSLPECDAVYLPGGYPELHATAISANARLRDALRKHHAAGKPILAECGGMMCLAEGLKLNDGPRYAMLGLLPMEVAMQKRLSAIGLQSVTLPEGELRGHTFHYSKMETALSPLARAVARRGGTPGEPVFREGRLTASYLHLYFASNPAATAALFLPD